MSTGFSEHAPVGPSTQIRNPFDTRMVFFRIGWMDRYRGVTSSDTIKRGGAFVEEHGFGFEAYNYLPFDGMVYGWVMPGRRKKGVELKIDMVNEDFATINLKRIGGKSSDQSLSNVIVVWVATAPEGGAYVVGWYKNATVLKQPQDPPEGANRTYGDFQVGYVTYADENDAVLLRPFERTIEVPQHGPGKMGQSNLWYADDPSNQYHRNVRQEVLNVIRGGAPNSPPLKPPVQPDVFLRQQVEKAAIKEVSKHFTELKYNVTSVERDNVGWDLEARMEKRFLRLEVKGLSGPELSIGLTPNEYIKMLEHRTSYHLCIVTNAITSPTLSIFRFSQETNDWRDNVDRVLLISEIVSANCRLEDEN